MADETSPELTARIAALESAVRALGEEVRGLRAPAGPSPALIFELAPPPGNEQPVVAATPRASLETRIGGQFLNRIGILAVLVGVAWFLKLAFDRNWISPSLQIVVGLALAVGLVVWSERFRRKGYPAFAQSLKGLGTGVAYLSLWAASGVYHLAPVWLVFLAMAAVTAANAALSWWQKSEILAMYALAGGLATPGLLSTGFGNETFLFSWLTLLNLGALLLLAVHGWSRIAWTALLGTSFYYLGWVFSAQALAHRLQTACFLCVFFLLFGTAPLVLLRRSRLSGLPLAGMVFPLAFPILNAATTWTALLLLYRGAHGQHQRFVATLLLAAVSLGMSWVARGLAVLAPTCLGLGVFLATCAIPQVFDGYEVTLFWLGESLLLIWLASAWAHGALRACGAGTLLLASFALLVDWIRGTPHPLAIVANMHFATALAGAGVFAAVTLISVRARSGVTAGWTWLGGFASVAFSVTLLVAVSLEIHHYWFCGAGFYRDFCTGYGQLERRRIVSGLGLSAWWMVYGAGLMAVGFWRRSSFVRWQALGLLAVSIAQVFLNGVSLESQGYRVLSFLGLGVLLLAVSFAYQKDWLRLRG